MNIAFISGLDRFYFHTGGGIENSMDNSAKGCTGGHNGYCDQDMYIWFQDRLGRVCNSHWLVNNWRWHHGLLGTNGDDAFDSSGWDGWTWKDAGCIKEYGLDVPNKVKLILELPTSHYVKFRAIVYFIIES